MPTATTVPLLRVATPVRLSWLLPGFALVTGLQLVPFHCSTTYQAGFIAVRAE